MKIYRKDTKIIFEVDFWQNALDYFGEKVGEVPNIIGVVCNDEHGNEELGFHKLIDMTYKDKEHQIDGLLVAYNGNKKDFIELCEKLELDVFEYPICAHCNKTVYGSFTVNKDGKPLCFDCEKKGEK